MFDKISTDKLSHISYFLFVVTMVVLIWTLLWPSLPKINLSDVVIVGVGASAITFLGSFLANRAADKRFKLQLDHDRIEKDIDRKHKFMEEIYIEASKNSTLLSCHIGNSIDGEIHNIGKSEEFKNFMSSMSSVAIVGSDDTINAINKLSLFITSEIMKLMEESIPVLKINADIEIIEKAKNPLQKQQERYLLEMTNYNLSGLNDYELFQRLSEQFDCVSTQLDESNAKLSTLYDEKNSQILELSNRVAELSMSFSKLAEPAFKSIKADLNIPFDEEKYSQDINSLREDVNKAYNHSVNEIVKKFED